MDFQDIIMRLNKYWADQGCLIWQPYNVQVGAGTWNPATALHVLGPEPWNVAYVETTVRPADGRYGENPNRWSQYYQYQVILKPEPGNPVELYLDSLKALGIDSREHDIRLVEDNWESPGLGAWGLGWEIWMDGQEITQYTYFQQSGGFDLSPVAVEITYGLERIAMVLQGVSDIAHIRWGNGVTYGEMLLRQEIEHCTYNFELADVERLRQMYALYEAEAMRALEAQLVIPAHDYVLKCSHVFNVLDARGAIGVTERAYYFARMRELSHQVAAVYRAQREEAGYPLLRQAEKPAAPPAPTVPPSTDEPADLLLEIGVEELPVDDLAGAIEQLRKNAPALFESARLGYDSLRVAGTPRRLVLYVDRLAARQTDAEMIVRGPPADVARDASGQPTKAALGFARGQGVAVEDLETRDYSGKSYLVCRKLEKGAPAVTILSTLLPELVASLKFAKSMRWDASGVWFSRPIRWLVALFGDQVVPFAYAGVQSGRTTRGLRPLGSPEIELRDARSFAEVMRANHIMVDPQERQDFVDTTTVALAAGIGARVPEDEALLREVTDLVEWPAPFMGAFGEEYLQLPQEVLIAVMKKHQRYFPVMDDGRLLPRFIGVANGPYEDLTAIQRGNEAVLRARYADAAYFYQKDTRQPLEAFLPRLSTLAFQERLGSMLEKQQRMEELVARLAEQIRVSAADKAVALRAARLSKADLATQMVIELTSLQGVMGAKYALLAGESEEVARAIEEQYLPRGAGDQVPQTVSGALLALSDRLDSLVGLFTVGLSPTGSSDPYGLRRAALGLVQILVQRQMSLSLSRAFRMAGALLPVSVAEEGYQALQEFVSQRLRGWLLDLGYRYDLVDAVLAERADNPYLAFETLRGLADWAKRPEFAILLTAYSRPSRIARPYPPLSLDRDLIEDGAERDLYQALDEVLQQRASRGAFEALETAGESLAVREAVWPGDVDELMSDLSRLVEPINRFFADVFVMVDDSRVRDNRLALLQRIAALPRGIADLTRVQGY